MNMRTQTFKVQAEDPIKEDADESHDLTVLLEDKPKTATDLNKNNGLSIKDLMGI